MNIEIINPHDLPTVNYNDLVIIQGNLKYLSPENEQKLLKSFKEKGFFVPVFVWNDDGVLKLLDGTQRVTTLRRNEVEPFEIPYVEIEAENIQDAKQKLLLITSQFGKVEDEGFIDFIKEAQLDFGWLGTSVDLDAIDVPDLVSSLSLEETKLTAAPENSDDDEEEKESKGSSPVPPTSSDVGYVNFDLVMFKDNKIKFLDLINEIKEAEDLNTTEEAIMYIVDNFKYKPKK